MRVSHPAREKEHGLSKEFIPPHWLVTLVWLVGFFAVWEAVAALVQATGGCYATAIPNGRGGGERDADKRV